MQKMMWLAEQAADGMFYLGWVSVLLLILIVLSAGFQKKGIREGGKRIFWLLLPLPGIFLILASGASLQENEVFWWVPYTGLAITLFLCCSAVWKHTKARFFASATCSFFLWYGLWCTFVSILSITDDWL